MSSTCRTHRHITLCACLGLLLASPAQGAKSDRDALIHINARNVALNEKAGTAVYRGDVTLTQGGLRIQADRVEVRTRNRRTEFVLAVGNPARLHQRAQHGGGDIFISAQRVEYYAAKRRVTLRGDVVMRQGQDVLRSSIAYYDLDEGNFTAQAGAEADDRVTAIIYPKVANTQENTPP